MNLKHLFLVFISLDANFDKFFFRYVKVYLLPDKSKSGKRKTKVKKHTLNPIFDEVLKFHISLSGLETRTLWLTVWHSDMFGRNDFLGEVMMSLENKVFDDPTPRSYTLQERVSKLSLDVAKINKQMTEFNYFNYSITD